MKASRKKKKNGKGKGTDINSTDIPKELKDLITGVGIIDTLIPNNKIGVSTKMRVGGMINNWILKKHYPLEQYECKTCGDILDEPTACTQQANCLNISAAAEQNIKTKK